MSTRRDIAVRQASQADIPAVQGLFEQFYAEEGFAEAVERISTNLPQLINQIGSTPRQVLREGVSHFDELDGNLVHVHPFMVKVIQRCGSFLSSVRARARARAGARVPNPLLEHDHVFVFPLPCCAPRACHTAGSVKWKALPLPISDSTRILPPCRSTMRLQIASPMPVPG